MASQHTAGVQLHGCTPWAFCHWNYKPVILLDRTTLFSSLAYQCVYRDQTSILHPNYKFGIHSGNVRTVLYSPILEINVLRWHIWLVSAATTTVLIIHNGKQTQETTKRPSKWENRLQALDTQLFEAQETCSKLYGLSSTQRRSACLDGQDFRCQDCYFTPALYDRSGGRVPPRQEGSSFSLQPVREGRTCSKASCSPAECTTWFISVLQFKMLHLFV